MWSTVRTLWPVPFGCMLDVTVLLDNWKIALSFAVVGRTFKPADLVNLSAKFTVGSAGTEGQGSLARVSECPFSFRCTQHPQGHVLRCILHYFVPSPWVPVAFRRLLPLPSKCSGCACRWSTDVGWQERRALLHALCTSRSKVPRAFPQETAILSVTNPTCQAPSVWGFDVHRQKLFVYLILIPCLHSRQWLCAWCLLAFICTLTSLYPWVIFTLSWQNICMCNMLLIFNQTP